MKVGIIGAGNMGGAIARGLEAGRIESGISSYPSEHEQPGGFGCRCGDCSGEAMENGRSIEAFAFAPASDIGIGSCRIDIRELGTLRRAGDADVPGDTEYRYLRAGEHDADSGAQRFGRAGADDVEPVQRNGACHADRRKAIRGGYIAHYVQAAMQAGVELGIRPKDAMKMVAQTVEGAARLLLDNEDTHPAIEIEKVTTPGGITIKGVNSLEHDGFTSAVIKAIKASL